MKMVMILGDQMTERLFYHFRVFQRVPTHLSCIILRLLGAMQLTLQSVIPLSLQIATEKRP